MSSECQHNGGSYQEEEDMGTYVNVHHKCAQCHVTMNISSYAK